VLEIECRHSDRERAVSQAQARVLKDLARRLDVKLITEDLAPSPPGQAIHECGVARMGDDPLTSVLNPNNECWDAKGLFVTDASCFVTQGLQSPTLTIMALTRRACLHAINTF
jgi:choline dehydrogenase-like flavoprotein